MSAPDPWSGWIAAQRAGDARGTLASAVLARLDGAPARPLAIPWWVAALLLLAVRAALGLVFLIAT